jgi:hypothetical protein
VVDTYKMKKNAQLGMPYNTARQRLVKMILFDMLKQLDRDTCFRCNGKMDNIDDLSIEHKESWVDVDPNLFWDLNNISFSHHKCNADHGRFNMKTKGSGRPPGIPNIASRKVYPEGKHYCYKCKSLLDTDQFCKASAKWHGLDSYCRECRRVDRNQYNKRKREKKINNMALSSSG